MKDPLTLLREAFDIYDSKKAPWEQSKANGDCGGGLPAEGVR